MFLVRVIEKKEEEGLFIFYFIFKWQCKIAHYRQLSPIISISDVLLEKEEEALFI
jgi:hypothetical protein